jgi:hypothetical protein
MPNKRRNFDGMPKGRLQSLQRWNELRKIAQSLRNVSRRIAQRRNVLSRNAQKENVRIKTVLALRRSERRIFNVALKR